MPPQPDMPEKCKNFKARQAYFGDERHDCFCGGTVMVCENCGGDWHDDEKERKNCPKFNPPEKPDSSNCCENSKKMRLPKVGEKCKACNQIFQKDELCAAMSGKNEPLLARYKVDIEKEFPFLRPRGNNIDPAWKALTQFIDKLISASDLLSYERGRDDQREEDVEIVEKFWYGDYQNEEDKKNLLKYKILNQTSDAK